MPPVASKVATGAERPHRHGRYRAVSLLPTRLALASSTRRMGCLRRRRQRKTSAPVTMQPLGSSREPQAPQAEAPARRLSALQAVEAHREREG